MSQGDLFRGGSARKADGQERVENNSHGWCQRMRDTAVEIARIEGRVDSDMLRVLADARNDHPHHPNAWGAVFRGPKWSIVGYKKSRYRTNNARRIGIWELL